MLVSFFKTTTVVCLLSNKKTVCLFSCCPRCCLYLLNAFHNILSSFSFCCTPYSTTNFQEYPWYSFQKQVIKLFLFCCCRSCIARVSPNNPRLFLSFGIPFFYPKQLLFFLLCISLFIHKVSFLTSFFFFLSRCKATRLFLLLFCRVQDTNKGSLNNCSLLSNLLLSHTRITTKAGHHFVWYHNVCNFDTKQVVYYFLVSLSYPDNVFVYCTSRASKQKKKYARVSIFGFVFFR